MWLWQKNNSGGFVCVMQTGTHTFCFDDKSLVVGKTGFRESKRMEQKHCRTLTLWMMSRAPFSAWILVSSVQNERFGEDLHPASLKHIHHFLQMCQKQRENVECSSVKWHKFATGRSQGFGSHRRAETVPRLVLDVFLDVVGTVRGTFSEKTEEQLPN